MQVAQETLSFEKYPWLGVLFFLSILNSLPTGAEAEKSKLRSSKQGNLAKNHSKDLSTDKKQHATFLYSSVCQHLPKSLSFANRYQRSAKPRFKLKKHSLGNKKFSLFHSHPNKKTTSAQARELKEKDKQHDQCLTKNSNIDKLADTIFNPLIDQEPKYSASWQNTRFLSGIWKNKHSIQECNGLVECGQMAQFSAGLKIAEFLTESNPDPLPIMLIVTMIPSAVDLNESEKDALITQITHTEPLTKMYKSHSALLFFEDTTENQAAILRLFKKPSKNGLRQLISNENPTICDVWADTHEQVHHLNPEDLDAGFLDEDVTLKAHSVFFPQQAKHRYHLLQQGKGGQIAALQHLFYTPELIGIDSFWKNHLDELHNSNSEEGHSYKK